MKDKLFVLTLLALSNAAVACGSSDNPSSAAGGASGHAGTTSAGGNGGAAAGGGGGATGGATNAGAAGMSGGSTGASPTGEVSICNGDGCPYGRCDNNSTTKCSSVYTGPVSASSTFCKADGEYCLITGSSAPFAFWAVRCASGVANPEKCDTSCGFGLGHATCS